jgi:hypothetical protein
MLLVLLTVHPCAPDPFDIRRSSFQFTSIHDER